MTYFSHLECGYCGEQYEPDKLWNLCIKCNKPLLARYNLKSAKTSFLKESLKNRPENLWRYEEMLPVKNNKFQISLNEGFTPLHHAKNLGKEIGFENLYIKDEGVNPTTSFKARGLCMAISKAKRTGCKRSFNSFCRKCCRSNERLCSTCRDESFRIYA